MALIRLAYATDLPTPEDALRKLAEVTEGAPRHAPTLPPIGPRASLAASSTAPERAPVQPVVAPSSAPVSTPKLARFEDVVALARARRDIQLVQALEQDVRLDRFEPGRISMSLTESASQTLTQTLARRLQDWTGDRWMVALVQGATAPTFREAAAKREAERTNGAAAHPLVRKVLERFKGARIVEVRAPEVLAPAAAPQSDDDVGYADSEPVIDDES
jgi:DNA polymerase-3 subunit gamma/tau